MRKMVRSVWVPIGSFVLAVALSFLSGPARTAIARRLPGSQTPADCTLTINTFNGNVTAVGWLGEPNPLRKTGALFWSGQYGGETNVITVNSKETMGLKLHIYLEEVDFDDPPQVKCDGIAYGKLSEANKTKAASFTEFQTVGWLQNFDDVADDQADLKSAISSATDKVVLMCLKEHPHLGPVNVIKLFKTIHTAQKRAELEFVIKANGTTSGGMSCADDKTAHADIKLRETGFGSGPLQ